METNPLPSVQLTTAQLETALNRPLLVKRRVKQVLIALISLLLLLFSLVMAFHAYIAWSLARPHIDPLRSNPSLSFGAAYEDITFPSLNDSSILSGWYIPAASSPSIGKTVIFSHGYGGNREEIWVPLYSLAQELHKQNYNVLMFDYGYVQPEISATGGIRESQELLGAVKYAKDKGAESVYIWGFSMGAGTALQAALQTKDIDGMILDSTFILEPETMYHNMKQIANLPKFPSLALVHLFFPLINGVSLNQIPYNQVKEAQYSMPILFIHGKQDQRAPYEMVQEIFRNQSAGSSSQLWLTPNDTHELIFKAQKKTYLSLTMGFLKGMNTKPALSASSGI
ncbi:alpha/beta fold hydrolase [Paenibacillus sp. WQ 127069]|jgi:pimeloyl-ACP methyl ester carboxylesterase|uniref:Alpha/beta fold hydrolase n=1 Tax=Paenibacillus baimaensis TaxID=2982185 RepID=A0ABT2UQP8_9BACL|nr:alpha/beta fold hydrolase [Paenibacillus sp. WQ 127069]MCU6796152.1 alpha/beta fold hydrolase [Paenibacillus sp. WQ 127069]